MSNTSTSKVVRRSFALPRALVEELHAYAPEDARGNLNRLVTIALREFAERRRREAFERAMAEMSADPAVQAECAAIADEFKVAETDGLGPDGHSQR